MDDPIAKIGFFQATFEWTVMSEAVLCSYYYQSIYYFIYGYFILLCKWADFDPKLENQVSSI